MAVFVCTELIQQSHADFSIFSELFRQETSTWLYRHHAVICANCRETEMPLGLNPIIIFMAKPKRKNRFSLFVSANGQSSLCMHSSPPRDLQPQKHPSFLCRHGVAVIRNRHQLHFSEGHFLSYIGDESDQDQYDGAEAKGCQTAVQQQENLWKERWSLRSC